MGINVSIVRKKLKWQATPFRVEGDIRGIPQESDLRQILFKNNHELNSQGLGPEMQEFTRETC